MAYADYNYYENVYFGNAISPESFPGLAARASEYIDAATMNRARSAAGEAQEAIKKATCAIADVLQDEGYLRKRSFTADRPVQSETVGPWTKNYGSTAATSAEASMVESRKREALQIYLGPYGLLRMRGYRA